ncbi:hypothetical protein FisN_24Lh147 [Fistulifera solaris]|uniref:YdbS-like PH domain-containing protein n=1 Tax=Fistulifera solaris TaxID=1519565 RepID=A0A1Z5K9B1_FISSO|nr:hypothetical protein FisN_24Lh147 [Fistulifera solaris]|eukprot:GAX22860.1 hypothetical protein FisN_24Lh147 [Fistulifera solaris]
MKFFTFTTALLFATPCVSAFSVQPASLTRCSKCTSTSRIWAEENQEAVFMPPAPAEDEDEDDDLLDKAELLGRGAAKVRIIPAAAAWARQAWVRYKITTRRIRVTSGIGGKEMAEIVYPDIVEIRTAKRLFGDGDLVAFLRDGAKFEMRNIPNFDEAMEFILKQVDPEVAEVYRSKGEVTRQ